MQVSIGNESGCEVVTGTPDELLTMANNYEKHAARRGYSGVLDREKARQIREAVNAHLCGSALWTGNIG